MKLIHPSFEIWKPNEGKDGYLKDIERAARVCYKSEDRITEDSYKKIVDSLIVSGHGAALEHGTIYVKCPYPYDEPEYWKSHICNTKSLDTETIISYLSHNKDDTDELFKYYLGAYKLKINPFARIEGYNIPHELALKKGTAVIDLALGGLFPYPRKIEEDTVRSSYESGFYAVTNYRVIIENKLKGLLNYIVPIEEIPINLKRISVKFICSRAIAQEFTRHRAFSFMMESQRYCNYSRDRFNNNITFIIPEWADFEEGEYTKPFSHYYGLTGTTAEALWYNSCFNSEEGYKTLLQEGKKPQEAREVLINSCKTELVMTGFIEDWKHFFELRCANNAHPEARRLAIPLKEEFIKREFIKE